MKFIILISTKPIKMLLENRSGRELFGKNQYCSTDLIVLSTASDCCHNMLPSTANAKCDYC
jgi:hypothetical protein